MDLIIYDAYIIHYYINPLWLVTLGQSYFTHPNYLVICCLIQETLLHPPNITPMGASNVWNVCSMSMAFNIAKIKHVHFYSKVNIFLLLFCNTQPLGPVADPLWPGLDYFWSTISLTMLYVWHFCPCLILLFGHCGVIHPCLVLLRCQCVGFLIATISAHLPQCMTNVLKCFSSLPCLSSSHTLSMTALGGLHCCLQWIIPCVQEPLFSHLDHYCRFWRK